ncbi:MAG: aldehyde dehydrogenase family protein [Methylacidiphilales bacterium]|nr:aldehyde dehydrogenase family protein [Candidatus Methylacidiphilales bacterium]MDW8348682.1 aldehyde dehydrogenase family protein [Verrucomicrobiae bacterium]
MNSRLPVRKTYKLYINGAFVRSEGGRTLPATTPDGTFLDNYAYATRKDLRDAVKACEIAQNDWAKKTAYLRSQILYRAAEMLEQRKHELIHEVARSTSVDSSTAQNEVDISIDRLVYFAGWADKYSQLFGSVNPVATSHFNFTIPEPMGVVIIFAPELPSLLAPISLLASVILSGNAAILIPSEKYPLPSLTLAEILATCDLPKGVVNILSSIHADLAPFAAEHMGIHAIVDASGNISLQKVLQNGSAINLKRYACRRLSPTAWATESAEDPYWILDTVEFKTAWHPIGL